MLYNKGGSDDNNKYKESELHLLNSFKGSISTASETVADSRVNMALKIKFLIDNGYIIYYMDTDCFVLNKPLPDWMVSDKALGKMKLECRVKEGVFLAPKVYAYITESGEEIIKVKGISQNALKHHNIHFEDIAKLLVRDASLELNQDKWFKNVMAGEISILETAYQLKVTSNKRKPVFINNVFSNTVPFNYNELV